MMEIVRARTPLVRHLTDDEIVTLHNKKGEPRSYRVRIWRGQEATPIVLVSATDTSRPLVMTTRMANYVLSAMLYHHPFGLLYFEDEQTKEGPGQFSQVVFEMWGNRHRLHLFNPTFIAQDWTHLESILGRAVER